MSVSGVPRSFANNPDLCVSNVGVDPRQNAVDCYEGPAASPSGGTAAGPGTAAATAAGGGAAAAPATGTGTAAAPAAGAEGTGPGSPAEGTLVSLHVKTTIKVMNSILLKTNAEGN